MEAPIETRKKPTLGMSKLRLALHPDILQTWLEGAMAQLWRFQICGTPKWVIYMDNFVKNR